MFNIHFAFIPVGIKMMLVNFVFVILNIYTVFAITLLQKKGYRERSFKCVSELPNSTLTWITPLTDKYVDQVNSISDKSSHVSDSWLYETFDQSNINGGYILDDEWQSFKTEVTTGNSEFLKLGSLQLANAPFSFSLRISKEAHLYLCQGEREPHLSKCYWIIISGWKGQSSAIRKCVDESVPRKNNNYPKYECAKKLVEVQGNPLDENEWKHFNVAIEREHLNIYKYDQREPFLGCKLDEAFEYNTIYVKSLNIVGFWKLHDYHQYIKRNLRGNINFMQINSNQQVCFNMYVSFSGKCTLELTITNKYESKIYKHLTFTNKENERWKNIHLNESTPYLDDPRVNIGLDCGNSKVMPNEDYVAVRSLKNCSNGPNVISLQIKEGYTNVSCSHLLDSKNIIIFTETNTDNINTNCKYNEFGEHCISCDKIYGTEFCDKTSICEKRGCYCAPGYYGKYCFQECLGGKFGTDCKENCGNCMSQGCNNIDGTCNGGCRKYYTGKQCKELLYPIIKSPPMKSSIECYTKCVLQFNLMEYIGNLQPNSYKMQQSGYRNRWNTIKEGNIDQKSVMINNLQVNTEYKFRIILCKENICNDDFDVPTYTLTTTCRDITQEDLEISLGIYSVQVNVKHNEELCPIFEYKYYVDSVPSLQYISMQERNILNGLQPYTTYSFNVIKKDAALFKVPLQTLEYKPSKVQNVQKIVNKTGIYLQWFEPASPNGILQNYTISYQFNSKVVGCTSTKSSKIETTIPMSQREFVIRNIQPYSQYDIQISGMNMKYLGEVESLTVYTLPNEEIDFDSYIVNYQKSTSKSATFFFKRVCNKIKSPTYLSAKAICSHSWCLPKSQEMQQTDQRDFFATIYNLFPFTNYIVELYVTAKRDMRNQVLLSSINITTKPDKPHKLENFSIFSSYRQNNEYTFMFKWDESVPPTGVLEQISFQISYYTFFGTYNERKDVIPNKCVIWKKQFCGNLTVPDGYNYNINIQAKNKDVDEYSESYVDTLNIDYWEKEPTLMPSQLQYLWNDDFTLNLTWQHPNYVKNKLEGFNIFIDKAKTYYYVELENLTYSYKYTFANDHHFLYEHFLLGVQAKSNSDTSATSELKVKSPPPLPQLIEDPRIIETQNDSILIQIPKIKTTSQESVIFVVVTQNVKNTESNEKCNLTKLDIKITDRKRWVAVEIRNVTIDNTIKIGARMSSFSKYLNCYLENRELEMENKYELEIISINIRNNLTRYVTSLLYYNNNFEKLDNSTGFSVLTAFLIILLIVGISAAIYYIRKNVKIRRLIPIAEYMDNDYSENNVYEVPIFYNLEYYTKLINISDFERYVQQSTEASGFEEQYNLFINRDDILSNYGNLPENRSKNRDITYLPFNYNRVVLSKLPGQPSSDYINASHIKNEEVSYIAAQSPIENTLDDFWRMIWEQNIENIVMIYDVNSKYWPETEDSLNFNGISVKLVSFGVHPDFKTRIFELTFLGHQRKIKHFSYTNWGEEKVALNPNSLVEFVWKILSIPRTEAPILVHCRDGVNKTGAIILIDLCLKMVEKQRKINVFYNQKLLREQRMHMVNSVELYKFVHYILLESLVTPKTAILCDTNFNTVIDEIDISSQMLYINRSNWYSKLLSNVSSTDIEMDSFKNRYQDIIPGNEGAIYLKEIKDDPKSKYINAVKVDNFLQKNKFIVTQQPMPQTVNDFWRLICECEIEIVISLQEQDLGDFTCCTYWPTSSSEKKNLQNLYLSHIETKTFPGYEIIYINMKFKMKKREIKIIHLKKWFYGNDYPNSIQYFITMHNAIVDWIDNDKQIIVTCKDGATGCGLFIAMCFMLRQIRLQHICDVCRTVQIIRRNRKQFVKNQVQLSYLYEIAKLYINESQLMNVKSLP